MSWSELPTEIIAQIIEYLDRDDLKPLRLVNKALGNASTIRLFRTVHVSSNSASFRRASQVAHSKRLCTIVRNLEYHIGILDPGYAGFDEFKRELPRTRRLERIKDPEEWLKEVLWCYRCWLEEIEHQREFLDDMQHESEIVEICKGFENIEEVKTIMDQYDNPFDEPRDYIGKRTGMPSLDLTNPEDLGVRVFTSLSHSLRDRPLATVYGGALSWEVFAEMVDREMLPNDLRCMETVKSLRLALDNSEYLERQHELVGHISGFGSFLKSARNLQTLALEFDEIPFQSQPYDMKGIPDMLFPCHWPSLYKLELFGISCEEQGLLQFLESHSTSLTTLELGDIELICPTGYAFDCILNLFKSIADSLSLEKVQLAGIFTNRLDQSWSVEIDDHDPHHIRTQLEQYLAGKISCPIPEDLLVRGKDPVDESRTVDMIRFSDPSWSWYPELLTRNQVDPDMEADIFNE